MRPYNHNNFNEKLSAKTKKNRLLKDLSNQSSDSKSDALSARLCGLKTKTLSIKNYNFASSLDEKVGSQKDSTTEGFEPQSYDSKSDALSVRLCGHKTIAFSIKYYNFASSFD